MDKIVFSYNWNNKLNCKAYTTFRLASNKYVKGGIYAIYLKDEYLHDAEIVDIRELSASHINDFIAYIDTGYDAKEFLQIIKKMYGDIDKRKFYFILLKRISK